MRRRRHQRGASVFVAALFFSAAVHLLFALPVKRLVEAYLAAKPASKPRDVRVVQISPAQWEANARRANAADNPLLRQRPQPAKNAPLAQAPAPEEKKKEPEKKVEERLTGQVVEVPPTRDDSPNPDAKYLSKYNSHVEKETTARADARNPKLGQVTNKLQTKDRPGRREAGAMKTLGLDVKGDGLKEDKEGSGEQSEFVLKVPDILKRDELQLDLGVGPGPSIENHSSSEAMKGNSDRLELKLSGNSKTDKPGEAGGKKGPKDGGQKSIPTLSALVPNLGTLARISGSPSRDHVDGVQEGEGTFLNTKEFKYATFFYRVRDSVADHWEDLAAQEYRRRDPTGHIYGIRDRATLLRVELDAKGELDDIRVEQTSGVDFLDHVAVEAFRRAQPFPNPPEGIRDVDGRIRFNFQFVITMSSRRGLNIFRKAYR